MKTKLLSALLVVGLIPVTVSAERLSLSSLQNQLNLLTTMLQDTNTQLAEARQELAALKNNSVLNLDGVLALTKDAAGNTTVLISSANLQLVNGSGFTDSVNGLGNFVIGYNASNEAFVDRFGSHNLVVGDDQSYPDTQEIITENLHSDHGLNLTVAEDMSTVIGGDQSASVASNRNLTVGRGNTRSVGGSETITIGVNKTISVGADQTQSIGANESISVGANRNIMVAANKAENIGGSTSMSVGNDANMNYTSDLNVIIGKNLSVDAGDQILIKTGKASGLLKKDGTIQIKGKDITLEGSGGINIKASGDVVIKGSKILQN